MITTYMYLADSYGRDACRFGHTLNNCPPQTVTVPIYQLLVSTCRTHKNHT